MTVCPLLRALGAGFPLRILGVDDLWWYSSFCHLDWSYPLLRILGADFPLRILGIDDLCDGAVLSAILTGRIGGLLGVV